jgi:hypothetical protein
MYGKASRPERNFERHSKHSTLCALSFSLFATLREQLVFLAGDAKIRPKAQRAEARLCYEAFNRNGLLIKVNSRVESPLHLY